MRLLKMALFAILVFGFHKPSLANILPVKIETDKASYKPSEKVVFRVSEILPPKTMVRYKLLDSIIAVTPVSARTWEWMTPAQDFKGYMVEIYDSKDDKKIYATIAVDVSSDPARFPRNAFLSDYGKLSKPYMDSIMRAINRYHMNYVQAQDWEYEHHKPLAGTVTQPEENWKDIGNRDNYKSTVQNYIALAHQYGMFTLHYNLIYGSLDNANAEGVSDEWRLYTNVKNKERERIALPMPPFKSGLNIMNPADTGWQNYLSENTAEAWKIYDFDGYQIDQMGDLNKSLYDATGNEVNMALTFEPFIKAIKRSFPKKRMVMNAVSQYGQDGIAQSPVDFLYTEVWPPDDGYKDLARVILHNDSLTNDKMRTVMAAYMDYDLAEKRGFFSTPGVIMTDAVIFAFGGSHLELGDHMLGKEYFPNAKLKMREDLKAAMISYYDFLTAYENLLRDGGKFNPPTVISNSRSLTLNNWPPKEGQVSVIGKDLGDKQVLHFINFNKANTLNWRDNKGTQAPPSIIGNAGFTFTSNKAIKMIWMASPDLNGGASTTIAFTQKGNKVSFILPTLQYWDMVVIRYQ